MIVSCFQALKFGLLFNAWLGMSRGRVEADVAVDDMEDVDEDDEDEEEEEEEKEEDETGVPDDGVDVGEDGNTGLPPASDKDTDQYIGDRNHREQADQLDLPTCWRMFTSNRPDFMPPPHSHTHSIRRVDSIPSSAMHKHSPQ